MSAFTVSDLHIRAMVHAGLTSSPFRGSGNGIVWIGASNTLVQLTELNADYVGNMLWRTNFEAVNHRYDTSNEEPVFNYRPFAGRLLEPLSVIRLADCYAYQTCEHRDWETSEAKRFNDALVNRLTSCLKGYDKLPWGAESISDLRFL